MCLTLDLPSQISLGDVQSNYLLTTAENELGVVVAHSEAGKQCLDCLNRTAFIWYNFPPKVFWPICWTTKCTPSLNFSISFPGAQMVPINWCEMQCPRTHTKEFRKVARVQPEYLHAWGEGRSPDASLSSTRNTQLHHRHCPAILIPPPTHVFIWTNGPSSCSWPAGL